MFSLDPYYLGSTQLWNWQTFSDRTYQAGGGAHPSHALVHALYYTIYLQTNELYAGDQKLWACFAMQLAKLFLTISRHSLELHKAATGKKKMKWDYSRSDIRSVVRPGPHKLEGRSISRWTETAGSLPVPCCKLSAPNYWLALILGFLINTLGQCFLTSLCGNSVPDRWKRGSVTSEIWGMRSFTEIISILKAPGSPA